MVDKSGEDVPPRVMEMLRIFMAASCRGEQAVLVLETRNKTLTTKYRCVETMEGAPATAHTSTVPSKKKVTPARARRSKLRLEKFQKKKVEEKMTSENEKDCGEVAGDSAAKLKDEVKDIQKKLLLDLSKRETEVFEKNNETSPIPQLDGEPSKDDSEMKYEFTSSYAEEDIVYTLEEIFPDTKVKLETLSQCQPRSAEYWYTVVVKVKLGQKLHWPDMMTDQAEVFNYLKKI